MSVAELDLDLEVFQGPFDLLLTLVLREEVDLLEVELADVVIAYIDHLERTGELDLEAATEFLVLIAALLELKSRLMLPCEDEDGARPRAGRGGGGAAGADARIPPLQGRGRAPARAAGGRGRLSLPRRAAAAAPAARVASRPPSAAYEPGAARRGGRRPAAAPPKLDLGHLARAARVDRVSACRTCARCWRAAGSFTFDEAVKGADRLTEAVTLFALLELYKAGEASWSQAEAVRADHREAGRPGMNELARVVEALLFLSPEPVSLERLADAVRVLRGRGDRGARAAARALRRGLPRRGAARGGGRLHAGHRPGGRARRASAAARKPRTPPLTQAQAECLGHRGLPAARLAAGDRPHPRRGVGVRRGHAARARA